MHKSKFFFQLLSRDMMEHQITATTPPPTRKITFVLTSTTTVYYSSKLMCVLSFICLAPL